MSLRIKAAPLALLLLAGMPGKATPQRSAVESRGYTLTRGGIVEVDAGTAHLSITRSQDGNVRIGGAASANLVVSASPAALMISRDAASRTDRMDVFVPEGVRVVARLTAGSATVRGLRGSIEIATQAGGIDIDDVSGAVKASSISGVVSVRNAAASVDAEVVAGRIEIADVRGDLHVRAIEGRVTIADVHSQVLSVETVSGAITCASAVPANASWALESFAGTVRLLVPRNSSAVFTSESFTGELRVDIPMTLESPTRGRLGPGQRRVMRLGEGSARISLKSFSGALVVQPLDGRGI